MTTNAHRSPLRLVGDTRSQYAWLPVRRYATPKPFTRPDGWLWLADTKQTLTGFEGWIAYADDNKGAKVFSDRSIALAMGIALLGLYCAVAVAIAPMVPHIPLPI